MKKQFQKDLIHSGFLHRPLPLYEEGSLEKQWEQRTVLKRRAIWSADTSLKAVHSGQGRISIIQDAQAGQILSLEGSTITYCWPEAMSPDGDCAFYGTVHAKLPIENENWENFHCLTFYVKPDCDGARIVNINLGIKNDGVIKVPDEYYREGSHVVNLKNHEWNKCIWEFGSMARDKITELEFNCRLNGKDTSSGEKVSFQIKEVYLEQVTDPEPDKGWFCKKEGIAYSSSGYFLQGQKQALTAHTAEVFQIIDASDNEVIYQGTAQKQCYLGEEYSILDFSCVDKEGSYRIKVDESMSKAFPISNEIYEDAIWKVLNFLFCERCGCPVPNKHGLCHQDVVAQHEGRIISFGGGWHDAGDMSQQLIHTAEVTQALFETAESIKQLIRQEEDKNQSIIDSDSVTDSDMDFKELLYERLIEEALWGLEFVLKSRFGDGYRATSAGLVRWTNGLIGDEDDVEVRCHNHAFENLLCSGICAIAAKHLKDTDEELAWKCLQIAEEDYNFGMNRWDTVGMELPIMWEHTYSSSKSQYYALISWTSSLLYERTGLVRYGEIAANYGGKLLLCQEQVGRAGGMKGFFYREEDNKIIVHYSHQSREYMFVQAFERLCETQPEHAQKAEWEKAMRLYGEYIMKLMEYASPYHMLPAGLYHENEVEDRESFQLLHLLVDYESQKEHYLQQLKAGFYIGDGYYIRNFPVWFSFRGNTAIHLAMGHAASIVGRYFHDDELLQLTKEQLYWISGKNPFHQSLMYGEGDRFMQQYAVMPGEMTGELPVGIQTNEDEDLPYWPHNNNATYKEVWTSSACRWLWSISSIYQGKQ